MLQVREASMAAAEAVKGVQAALQTTDVPARVLPARLTNTITDKLHVLLTPTLKVTESAPGITTCYCITVLALLLE